VEQRERNANGTFVKGHPSIAGARRKKGELNKITKDIREGAIAGFARHGSNGHGEGGFAGFCFYLAKKHPKAAARIVEKLLPLNVNATGIGGASIGTVNIVSVPEGRFLTPEAIAQMRDPGHGPTLIECDPSPQLEAAGAPDESQIAEAAIAPEPALEPAQEPAEEPDSVLLRARALGYTPLPPRPRQVY
jgi:hypothetical protein